MSWTEIVKKLLETFIQSQSSAPATGSTSAPLWETPDGLLTMKAMRYQLVKASGGMTELWGYGGSKSDDDVVAKIAEHKGYCEPYK